MSAFFIDPDISIAKTLDKDFYLDRSCYELAKQKVFLPAWHYVGDSDLVSKSGQCMPFNLLEDYLNEPLILTRDKSNRLHCLPNVCTHRGNLLVSSACQTSNIRCKYHGRLFNLDGSFISMPEFKEVKNFPSEADSLRNLPLFNWGKWLFTTLGDKFPAEKFLQPMMDRMAWLPVDKFVYKPDLSRTYTVMANWALYCENYLEGFHIPFVHADLNAVIDYGNYTTELFEYSNLQLGIAKDSEDCFELPESSPDYGKNVAAYYFWIFPNMMFNFYPWGLSINIVKPISVNQTKVSFISFVYDESQMKGGAGSQLDKVEKEDEEVVENVQRGLRSRFYQHGRYSVTREQGTHHFHRLIEQFMNE